VAPHPDTFPPQKQDGEKKRSRGCCLILTLTVTDAQAMAIDRHWAQPQPQDKNGSRAVHRERAVSGKEHGDKNMVWAWETPARQRETTTLDSSNAVPSKTKTSSLFMPREVQMALTSPIYHAQNTKTIAHYTYILKCIVPLHC